jgi:hypothetical protein
MPQVARPGEWRCQERDKLAVQCALVARHYGQHMTEAEVAAAAPEPIVVWSYPGRTQADAASAFQAHAAELAQHGYRPVAQSWGEGRPGVARVLAIGDAATAIRPKGFLSVTYELRLAQPAATPPAPDPIEQLRKLGELRDLGVVTPAEFDAKKAELLARL